LFALCSAARDSGSLVFETTALLEHLRFHVGMLAQVRGEQGGIRVAVTDWAGEHSQVLQDRVLSPLHEEFPVATFDLDSSRSRGRNYYQTICFEVLAKGADGREQSLCDGGFTDWTAKLLSNRKERLLISGIGLDRACILFKNKS
jgi:hypothetical protein